MEQPCNNNPPTQSRRTLTADFNHLSLLVHYALKHLCSILVAAYTIGNIISEAGEIRICWV